MRRLHADESHTHMLDFGGGSGEPRTLFVREVVYVPPGGASFKTDARDDSTGALIWESALILARWLAASPELVEGRRVMELGAGCGTAGLAAAVWGRPRAVCLQDFADVTYENLVFNVAANACAVAGLSAAEVTTCRFDWAAPGTWPSPGEWDAVIGADLVYTDSMAPVLAGVAAGLLHARGGARLLLVSPDGRAGLAPLVAALGARGFVLDAQPAPRAYHAFPVRGASEADECLHFVQLKWTTYRLLTFTHVV